MGSSFSQKIYTLNYNRLFDPDEGVRWKKGELLQMVIGASMAEDKAHSHKLEVRLGDEIRMPVKNAHL